MKKKEAGALYYGAFICIFCLFTFCGDNRNDPDRLDDNYNNRNIPIDSPNRQGYGNDTMRNSPGTSDTTHRNNRPAGTGTDTGNRGY